MAFDFKKFIGDWAERSLSEYNNADFPTTNNEIMSGLKWVEMRDGTHLKTMYYIPSFGESFPTIIQRSCYPMFEPVYKVHAEEFAKRGYGFVYQFCRGTGGSEGVWEPNVNERNDGIDTINWLCEEQWVKSIGYWGSSYLALTGWVIADIVPEKVKTMLLTHYGTQRFTSAYKDGLFRQDILTAWAMDNAGFPINADYIESCKYMPHIDVDKELWGKEIPWYRDWITSTNAEDPYWETGFWKMLKTIPSKVRIPIFIGEGWYDHHLGSALEGYNALSEESKAHSTLEIGCWNHSFKPCLENRYCENLKNSEVVQALKWFERLLKNEELPNKSIATYVIGDDQWKTWGSYPLPDNEQKTFYLSNKMFHNNENTFSIEATERNIDGVIEYVYDPKNPVMSHGSEAMLKTMTGVGSLLQPSPSYRADVISFVSEAIEEDVEITGSLEIKLFVSTDAEDTAFAGKIMEVQSNGDAVNIRSSITTIGHTEKNYQPNDIVEISIKMWDIVWKMKKGSSLRIDISSSNFPEYNIHSNYKGIWSTQKDVKIATQKLYTGINYPSKIIIPVS